MGKTKVQDTKLEKLNLWSIVFEQQYSQISSIDFLSSCFWWHFIADTCIALKGSTRLENYE